MDFVIGLIVGLFFGGLFGFFVSALMIANGNTDQEPDPDEIAEEPDGGMNLVFKETLDELRKRQQERFDSEAWQDDMYYDAQQYEAEKEANNE